ncbi:transcriptional regulator, LacI family [Deinococcus marmoris]|uniref:Transcriptional regulator, LacI family n=2 Tax=Deinococcus marmoris TaxID=249408 RepID=A0A1U7NVK5_9DEIO|nr:transcriptional regulator, LacI family [Deinococcus marmoris]
MAVGALRGLDRAGVAVPGDMQIVGYSDVSAAEAAHLTTVHVPRRRLGRHAARLAAHLAWGEAEAPIHWTLPPSLVIRDTTRPLKGTP